MRSGIRVISLALLIANPSLAVDATAEQTPPKAPFETVRNIPYAEVNGKPILLDLRVPMNAQRPPLVVWIHGGGWVGGDKEKCRICWLARKGFAVASINYRLLKDAIFPAQIHDCKAAIRWLRANEERYGYDASRIGAAGSSAGGHLSALLGTTGGIQELEGAVGGNLAESSRVQAVVSISGLSDLETSYASHPDPRVALLIGGTPAEQPERSLSASPLHFVGSDASPLLLIHGEKDPIVDPQQAVQLHRAYQNAKLDSWLEMIPGTGHMDLSLRDARIRALIEKFLTRHLKP
jgi:acetyl esterase/lipase